jgi:DNA (cytosine-5)-methyltransferase 1
VSLVEPFISVQRNNNTPKSLDEPVPVLCTGGHVALVEPFITRYYGSGSGLEAASVERPLDTVTTKARFGLCQPVVDGYVLDINFRMLQPAELAAAMSFPVGYDFAGNKGDAIRQIGNAVDCRMAQALVGAILDARTPSAKRRREEVA